MKKFTKRDYHVLEVVLAELARMKSVGVDDGVFRGMTIEYRIHTCDANKVTAHVTVPGWEKYPHDVVLQKQGDDWIAIQEWFYDGIVSRDLTYADGRMIQGEPQLHF